VNGPTVTTSTNQITISATFQNITITGGPATVAIPSMPNSNVEISAGANGQGVLLQANISASDVVKLAGGNTLPPQELPGGRPLPGVAAGELPAIAVQIPQLDNIVVYVGPTVLGMFVPVTFQVDQIIGTYDFYGSNGTNIGQISMVGEDNNGKNSGFLLMLNLGNLAQDMIQENKLVLPLN